MSGDARGDLSGSTVGNGRYRLRSLLGEGGMASVHLGYDTVLERDVAVKTLHSDLGREQSFRERFRREAQSVAKLNHTNIVSVFDSGEDVLDGRSVPYIVMEYVEGKPLRQILDEDVAQYGAMPAEKALKITADVLAALAVSHEMGLVHRDIKPGNVMVTRRGVVKVMDFGIARALQSGVTSMTQTGMVVGTPQYLSPEQALGRGVDARSDLYSTGCMLFELLTGRLPFDGDSPLSIAYQHVQEEPPPPSRINQSVQPAVDALVARALRKNPAERFPTAEAMQDEVERVATAAKGAPTPLVISDGPRVNHGAGHSDSFAVFPHPQANLNAQVQGPPLGVYQPQTPPPQMNYGPATPPPPTDPGFQQRYNQGAYVPPGPPPTPSQFSTPAQPSRPSMRTPLIVLGSIVGVVAVIVLALLLSHRTAGTPTASDSGGTGQSATAPAAAGACGAGVKCGDPSRTVDPTTCTNAGTAYTGNDRNAVIMPDLTFKYIDSVKACMDGAGWKYTLKPYNENVWGKGIVMSQTPERFTNFNPKNRKITLYVSTGRSGG